MTTSMFFSPFLSASIRVIRGLFSLFFFAGAFTAQGQGLPPRITSQPKDQIVAAGTDVKLAVVLAPSATPLRVQWKKLLRVES